MRQLVSTALVACIVAALTAVTVGVVAQAPAEPPVSTTALNADTVDRLSAVKATKNKKARRNRLVATDAKGFLPSNIVKPLWRLVSGKPAVLADGQVGWNEVVSIPASFADGVDDVGVTGVTITTVVSDPIALPPNGELAVVADCPAGVVVGGGFSSSNYNPRFVVSRPDDADSWVAYAKNTSGTASANIYAIAICLRSEPASAIVTATKGMKPARLRPRVK